jgi:hypothetical protein
MMRTLALSAALATLVVMGTATAGEAPKCALAEGLVFLHVEAGKVTVAKGGKTFTIQGKAGTEVAIDLSRIGLAAGQERRYIGWNHDSQTFIPPFTSPLKLTLGPDAEQKVNIRPLETHPQLVSARGGCIRVQWDDQKKVLRGASRVPANVEYELRITCPPKPKRWMLEAADVAKADWDAGVVPEPWQSGPWAGVILHSPEEREVAWEIHFKTTGRRAEQATVAALKAVPLSHRRVEVRWGGGGGYYRLKRNDRPAVGLFRNHYLDKRVMPKTTYTYTVSAISWSGEAKAAASVQVTTPDGPPPLPAPDVCLSNLKPTKATVGWNDYPRKDKSIEDNPIRIAGEEYEKGMGVHALSELVYDLKPDYARFVSYVGVDDEKGGAGTVTFEVHVDGKKVWESGRMTGGDIAKEVNVKLPDGAKTLRLVVGDAGDGIGSDHADWAEAGFVVEK